MQSFISHLFWKDKITNLSKSNLFSSMMPLITFLSPEVAEETNARRKVSATCEAHD